MNIKEKVKDLLNEIIKEEKGIEIDDKPVELKKVNELNPISKEVWELVKNPDLLKRYLEDINKVYVGREKEILLLRILMEIRKREEEGLFIYIVGLSGEGKSTLAKTILSTINPDDVIFYTDISPMALKNYSFNLSHKIFYFSESDAVEDKNQLVYHIRSAISEGEISSITAKREGKIGVEKNKIETKGTIFITTNEEIFKDRELDRRSIIIRLDFDPELTKKYFDRIKDEKNLNPDTSHLSIWQQVDKIIHPVKIKIPYWSLIVEHFSKDKPRYKTDIKTIHKILGCIVQLHQYQRETTEQGEYIATLKDYEILYELSPLLISNLDLPEKYKKILEILNQNREDGLTRDEILERLKEYGINLEYETLRRYLRELNYRGYIQLEGKGKTQKIFLIENYNSSFSILPHPDKIKEYIHNSNPKIPIEVNSLSINNFHWDNPKSQKIPKSQFITTKEEKLGNWEKLGFLTIPVEILDAQGKKSNWEIGIENINNKLFPTIKKETFLNQLEKIKKSDINLFKLIDELYCKILGENINPETITEEDIQHFLTYYHIFSKNKKEDKFSLF
mgnify:CR=1 FL=1